MAQAQLSNATKGTYHFKEFNSNDQDTLIDEGIGNSPQTMIPCSPITQQDHYSLESNVIKLDNFVDQLVDSADHTDIAEEVEIETSPLSPQNSLTEMTHSSLRDSVSSDISNSAVSILMKNATAYEDISEDEDMTDSLAEDRFTTELVSLLTPESTLIEEDSGIGTGSSSTSCSSVITNSYTLNNSAIKAIPVSTIRWAPKAEVGELLYSHEMMEIEPKTNTLMEDAAGEDEDIIFLGAFTANGIPQSVPCFLPCCQNDLVIPVPIIHPRHDGYTVNMHPQPRLFPEPPESEWVTTNVYHLDPLDGILRYKCQSCDGIVEQKSFRSRFQLYTQQFQHQCPRCEKKYFTKKQLQLHQFRHKERHLPCPFCERKFLTKSELQNHINTHTQRKSFGCPVCSAAFAHSSRYYSHLRTFHKKYNCEECFNKVCGMSSATNT